MATRNPLAAAARGAGAIQTSSSREERAPGASGAPASGAAALAGGGESVETANPLALRRAGTFRVVAGCSLKEALRYMDDLHPRRKDEFYEDTIEVRVRRARAGGRDDRGPSEKGRETAAAGMTGTSSRTPRAARRGRQQPRRAAASDGKQGARVRLSPARASPSRPCASRWIGSDRKSR